MKSILHSIFHIPYSIYKWCTTTRLRKFLSGTLAILILLTSIRYLFFLNPKEAKATITEITGSSSETLSSTTYASIPTTAMSVTPGAGSFLAVFTMEVMFDTLAAGGNDLFVSIYVNDVQQAHTERVLESNSSLDADVLDITTHGYITVGAGQTVEVKYRIDTTPNMTGRDRALTLYPVNPKNATQAIDTTTDTLNSGTYTLMDSMSITPQAGDYLLVFSTSADGATSQALNNFAVFVGDTIVQHTERTYFQEGSVVPIIFPVLIAAKVSPTAGQTVEVRWRTTGAGGSANAYERTLTLIKVGSGELFEANSATDNENSINTTDARVDSMVLTPGAGNYLAIFSSTTDYDTTSTNRSTFYSFYENGVQKASSEREFMHEDSLDIGTPLDINNFISSKVTIGAGQDVEVKWRSNVTDARDVKERTFILLKDPATPVYLGFDEGYGTSVNDSNQNVGPGTITNALWRQEDLCRFGKCLYYDGTGDYVSFSDDSDFDAVSGESMTIEGWFRTPDITSGTRTLIAKEESTGADGGYKIEINSSGFVVLGIDNDNVSFPSDSVTSTLAYDDNKWHHFAAVKDGSSSLTLYIDATSVGTPDASPAADIGNNDSFYIGIYNGSSNGFSGFIDEVKVYRSARTAAEIKSDYLQETPYRGTSASFGGGDQSYLSQGLVGYWKLDETSTGAVAVTRNDSSGNNNNLTDNNTVASATGKFDEGADFENNPVDNNENLSITDASQSGLDLTGNMTIAAWVKAETIGVTQAVAGKDGDPVSNNEGYYIRISSSNQFQFLIAAPSDGVTMTTASAATTTASAGTWYHMVGVYDGSKVYIYVNGVQEGSNTPTESGIRDSTEAFRIGIVRTSSLEFDGVVDDVRVYNRALSNKEVQSLYNWAPGPLAHWKFDENTGTSTSNDSSGNNNPLTMNGGINRWSPCKFGSCLPFDGTDDQLITTSTSAFDDLPQLTVSAWVYSSTDTYSVNARIASKQLSNGNGWVLNWGASSNRVYFGADFDGASDLTVRGSPMNANTWNFMTATWDGSSAATGVKLYLNGTEVTYAEQTSGIGNRVADNTNEVSIGIAGNGTTGPFNGFIDDVRIYNYIRTPGQVIEDMNGGHPTPGSPIGSAVAYWKFDEGYSTTAYDSNPTTGGAEDLTLSGAIWTNSGKYGKAWDGNGKRWVQRSYDADLNFLATDSFTISGWFKSGSATNPANGTEYILSTSAANIDVGYQIYAKTNGTICFAIDDDGVWTDVESCTTSDYYDGVWHQFTAVRNTGSDTVKLYIDAAEKSSNTDPTTGTLDGSNVFYLGDFDGDDNATAGTEEFEGDLDEFKIYRFALTTDQINVEYNRGSQAIMGATSTNYNAGTITASWAASDGYCPPGQGSACTSPSGEWKLDENTGTSAFDTSGSGFTGTLGGTTGNPSWVPSVKGAGLSFIRANTQYVSMGNVLDKTDGQDFSITGWIYLTDLSVSGNDFSVMTKKNSQNGASAGYNVFVNDLTGNIRLVVADGTNAYQIESSSGVTAGAWYHFAAVWDDSQADSTNTTTDNTEVYINGRDTDATGSFPVGASPVGSPSNTLNLFMGGRGSGAAPTTDLWDGKMDNIRFYDYVLTPAQVAWDYNRGGTVGWWKFDENTGTTTSDSSGNALNSQTFSGNTTWATGKRNTALTFDGTGDYVSVSDNALLDITGDFTLSAWVSRAGGTNEYVISKWGNVAGSGGYSLLMGTSGEVYCRTDNGTTYTDSYTVTGIVNTDSVWHHILAVRSGSSCKVYVDGVDRTNTAGTHTSLTANALVLRFGAHSNATPGDYMNGKIDDARVYNYAMTDQQIRELYNSGALFFGPATGSP